MTTPKNLIGDDAGDEEVEILKRTLKHTGDGLEYLADPRHEGNDWTRLRRMRRNR